MTTRYFRQVIQIEVLSEDVPLEWDALTDIAHAISEGDCVGRVQEILSERISPKFTAQLLREYGSDPGFFQLDDAGKAVDDAHA